MAHTVEVDQEVSPVIVKSTEQGGHQGHILIVDDEPNFRFATGIALRRAGYTITAAEDGQAALNLILNRGNTPPFDLLLIDIQMPRMSGTELVDELSRLDIRIPVFVVSGFADPGLADELAEKGCLGLLSKPFEPNVLIEKVRSALDTYRNKGDCPCPI